MTGKRSDGTILHQRVQQPWPHDKPFKILSIDGGGIKGILPAIILREIERELCNGAPITSYFDLISGTSTGGILAVGLAARKTAQELFDLYCNPELGGKIFRRSKNPMLSIWGTMHDRAPLDTMILETLGHRKFGESAVRLVVPAVNQHGEPTMYKTDHHLDYKRDHSETMARVALDTSAAPIYLGGNITGEEVCVDGGLFMNNPIMGAVVDALSCYDVSRTKVEVLSLGCGRLTKEINVKKASGGLLSWRDTVEYVSQLQSHNALGQAGLLISRQNIVRLDPELSTPIAMDDFKESLSRLPELGATTYRREKEKIKPFFNETVSPRERHYHPV